ncbi:MAG: chromosomal replication initiator protein DnaA [Lachnospiraceae bacterium]|nr:chromosomal replication initiator protein DnaA [Lachnospiraceae bacterium]
MNDKDILSKNWEDIKSSIKEEYDIFDVPFNTWIKPLQIFSVEADLIRILVPNEQQTGVDIIAKKYKSLFIVEISKVLNKEYKVEFISEDTRDRLQSLKLPINNSEGANRNDFNLNPKYTFDTFVVGPNNRMPFSAALAVSEDPGKVYNPLFIYGGSGLGKTHLMHSIGHHILEKYPSMKVKYVTSENFTNEVVDSIKMGSTANLRERYRTVDVLLLDDVQSIIGRTQTQEEFFNTFNALHAQNKAIIISSDKPPKAMETLEERLRSRFEWGLTVDINPPEYETRKAILLQYAETLSLNVDDEIIDYIASNIKSNIRELEGALNKVMAHKNLNNGIITLKTAQEAIADMITADQPQKITPKMVIDEVAKFFRIGADDIISQKRNKEIVLPRHVAMYLCREITDAPLSEIGKVMGNRDHTTVIHGHSKVEKDLSTNKQLQSDVEDIKKKILPPLQ